MKLFSSPFHLKKVFECFLFFFLVFKESDIPKKLENEMTLNKVPENHKLLDVNKLEEEGNELFVSLLKFQASPHISRYIFTVTYTHASM